MESWGMAKPRESKQKEGEQLGGKYWLMVHLFTWRENSAVKKLLTFSSGQINST